MLPICRHGPQTPAVLRQSLATRPGAEANGGGTRCASGAPCPALRGIPGQLTRVGNGMSNGSSAVWPLIGRVSVEMVADPLPLIEHLEVSTAHRLGEIRWLQHRFLLSLPPTWSAL